MSLGLLSLLRLQFGHELLDSVKGRTNEHATRLVIGIADVVPKLIAHRLLQPALDLPERVRLVCREGETERLLADLSIHRCDLVLTDVPIAPLLKIRAFSHLLGECGVTFLGVSKLAKAHRRAFPRSLDGAPILLPTDNTALRRPLDHWFDELGFRPVVRAEIEDSSLLKAFGQAGVGIFAVPSAIEKEVCKQYGVEVVGRVDHIRERFYAISVERRLKHPAVRAIMEAAQKGAFGV